ncbi:hypothetical protein FRC08_018348 [Ceratobasidium sp. 394]|nr:hypothetical protein FRC08_018348 [Ceratobasidium sp. 394]KAG9091107.1 hypothetical protein FS749_016788 [Ceratobasidium sp. UAMH 11750]
MSQALRDAREQAIAFSQVLQGLAATDWELDQAGLDALKDLLPAFSDVRKKLGVAKKKLEEAKPTRKRKSNENDGGKDKRQKDEVLEPVKFGDAVFIEEMVQLVGDQQLELYDFFKKMMGPNIGTRKDELTVGLALVLQGVREFVPGAIANELEAYTRTAVRGRMGMPTSNISDLGPDALAKIYVATEVGAGGILEQRSGQQLCQHLHHVLGALRFILAWKAMEGQDDGRQKQQALLVVIFRKQKHMEPEVAVNKQSNEWITFRTQAKDYRRGAARLWNAYRTLGSLVLLCPQMAFRFFYDSRLGKELGMVIHAIASSIKDGDMMDTREEVHREVLLGVLVVFESSEGVLVKMLKDVEALIPTTGIMEVDAMD